MSFDSKVQEVQIAEIEKSAENRTGELSLELKRQKMAEQEALQAEANRCHEVLRQNQEHILNVEQEMGTPKNSFSDSMFSPLSISPIRNSWWSIH